MDRIYWQKQTKDSPLFPDLLWSRPETRLHAGKLLIIGGNGYEFKAPANAYGDALEAGIGTAKVLLPDSMKKTVEDIFPEAEFATSTHSGSFARAALEQLLSLAEWADGVLLAGDLGHNSETAIVLESFLTKYDRQLTIAGDAIDYCLGMAPICLERPDTTLILTSAQLQKLGTAAHYTAAFTSDMALLQLVEQLHDFSSQYPANLLVQHDGSIVVAVQGRICSTNDPQTVNLTAVAAHGSVWWLQNSSKPYEALTTSLLEQP